MTIRATPRQRLGQVATPAPLADAMAAWVLDGARPPRTLLEPGSGGFVFTRAAQRRVPGIAATGVELDPAAGRAPPGVRLVIGDFLDDAVLGGAQFDAVLCNPPYVRHHHLEPAYKVDLAARLGGRNGLALSGLAGTHVYFLLRALELAAPGARVAFVTGAEWLEAAYGTPLRRWLVERGWLRAVLVASPEAEVFPGVMSTAAVLLLEKSYSPLGAAHRVGLSVEELVAAVAGGGAGLERVALGGDRWTAAPRVADGPTLGDRFRVRRGVATGANDFFVLDAVRVAELGIPERHLVPCVAGPRDLSPRFLLRVAPGAHPGRAVDRYLAEGEALGLDARYLCRTRTPWYRVEELAPAPLLLGYMARTGICVVDNRRRRAVHLNLLHGIYPRPGTPARMVDALRRYLESPEGQAAARASARRYAGGLLKLEPRDAERIAVPAALG